MQDEKKCEYYVVGDLVKYVGNVYIPDYMYLNEIESQQTGLGVIISVTKNMHIDDYSKMYRVYWFKTNFCTYISADQLRLAYVKK